MIAPSSATRRDANGGRAILTETEIRAASSSIAGLCRTDSLSPSDPRALNRARRVLPPRGRSAGGERLTLFGDVMAAKKSKERAAKRAATAAKELPMTVYGFWEDNGYPERGFLRSATDPSELGVNSDATQRVGVYKLQHYATINGGATPVVK